MIDRFEALVLGVVQGATEYLPVSSSGHLVLFQHFFGLSEPALLFDIVLHVATLLAVLWYYRRDIDVLVQQSMSAIGAFGRGTGWSEIQRQYPGFRLAWLIAVGTVPTALIGITLQDTFEELYGSIATVGAMLWLTGIILLATRFTGDGERDIAQVQVIDALLIGLIQGLAITPGISRSGSTIGVALLLGFRGETAARYSFLLSVPSIIGALALKIGDVGDGIGLTATLVGFGAALVTGYLSLAFLVKIVGRGRLAWFAPYCFLVGTLALFWASRTPATDSVLDGGLQMVDQVPELLLPAIDVQLPVLLAEETRLLEQQRGAAVGTRLQGPFDQGRLGIVEGYRSLAGPAPHEAPRRVELLDPHGEAAVLLPAEPAFTARLGSKGGAVAEPYGHRGGVGQGAPDLLG